MTVHIDGDRARGVARRLGWEIGQVERQRAVVKNEVPLSLNDFGSLSDAQRLLSEFVEEATLLADMLNARANISEAADNGASPADIAAMEEEVAKTFGLAITSLNDGRGASGSTYEKLVGIDLGLFEGDDIDQATYNFAISGDFDLATGLYPSDAGGIPWGSSITLAPSDYKGVDGEELVYYGGGSVLGPDGRYYPIVIPTLTKDGQHVSNGFDVRGDDGWTTIGYSTGSTQFDADIPWWGKGAQAAGSASGQQYPGVPDDELVNAIEFRGDRPPRIINVPAADADTSGHVSSGSGVVDGAVAAYGALVTWNSANDNTNRAYEVEFEQHATGAKRARVTTFQLVEGGPHGVSLQSSNIYADGSGTASQLPAIYSSESYDSDETGVEAQSHLAYPNRGFDSDQEEARADYFSKNGQHLGETVFEIQDGPGS